MGRKKIRRTLSALLLLTSIAVTQIPVSDVTAQTVSDFQIENRTLVKYSGTADQAVSVPAQVKTIGEASFSGHNELVKVTIANDVEKINNSAFADCNSLRTVVIGDSVKEIESGAFSNCPNLTSVTIGSGLRELGSGVFAGCSSLKNITVASGNNSLTYRSGVLYNKDETIIFQLLPGYEIENYDMPDSVAKIRGYAFWGNPYLKNVVFGNSLTDVPAYAFSNCVNLSQVTLSHLVRSIGAKAFENCVNLKKTNIPSSVSRIHDTAFDGCPKVDFDVVEGSYGAEYAAGRDVSQVAQTEQAEVEAPVVIRSEDTADADSGDSPDDTVDADSADSPAETADDEASSLVPLTDRALMGQSRIVSGRAVVFIDNAAAVHSGSAGSGLPDSGQITDGLDNAGSANSGEAESYSGGGSGSSGAPNDVLDSLMSGSDEKGFGFPKYTVLEDRIIADQAYYQETQLVSYEIPQGIEEIGDFSFARTGLREINIPAGVERIGYAAFYHCDNLQKVEIPATVTEIEPSAFEHTAWMKNWMNQVGQDYLIVGDGILLAYSGKNSVVTIPEGVKRIAPEVFKDHLGITVVSLPKSLAVIGEEAFAGCRNLKTVNGGEGVTEIRDRAFQDCILSKVVITEHVQNIGLRAFDLGEGGTGSVTFTGSKLPQISAEKTAMRLANDAYRDWVFGDMETAYVSDADIELTDTVLDGSLLGFNGTVCLTDGTVIREGASETAAAGEGIAVRISSRHLTDDGVASADIPGESGGYILKIVDSDSAADQITKAYQSLYGNQEPVSLLAFDISLYQQSGNAQVTKLGKQHAEIVIPWPANLGTGNLHVVCVDANGQLEEVPHQIDSIGEKEVIRFTAGHFSAYGIYQYGGTLAAADGRTVIGSLSGQRDASPDTGDFLHPKWFLAFGLFCTAVVLCFQRERNKEDVLKKIL